MQTLQNIIGEKKFFKFKNYLNSKKKEIISSKNDRIENIVSK